MTSAELLYEAAVAHLRGGLPSEARETAVAGLRLDHDHAGLWQVFGLSCYELEAFDEALDALERATCLGVLAPHTQLALAELYTRRGLTMASEAIYVFLAEESRCPINLLSPVASGLGRCGRFAEALSVCQRLITVRPEHHAAWFGIGYYQLKLGATPADAIPAVAMAQRLAPDSLSYRLSLVSLFAESKGYTAAYELLRVVSAEKIRCPMMVNRCIQVFAHVGDAANVREYERWFARMAEARPETHR